MAREAWHRAAFCALHLLCHLASVRVDTYQIDGLSTSSKIRELAEHTIGSKHIQDQFDNLQFRETPVNGQTLVDQLSASIGESFKSTFSAVTKLSLAIASEYENGTFTERFTQELLLQDGRQCCMTDDSDLEESIDFRAKVDLRSACFRFSRDTDDDARIPFSDKILDVMMENLFDEKLLKFTKTQYFGSNEGLVVTYPRLRDDTSARPCHSVKNDPRFQSWYVESATTFPKDIIVVLDKSSSMRDLMSISKEAAGVVLSTLSTEDRVGIIAFNDVPETASVTGRTCYSRELAFATRENKKHISKWIDGLQPVGSSKFLPALHKAFDLFEHKPQVDGDPRDRRRLILLLTDGNPSDVISDGSNVLDLLRERNLRLNNSVSVFTYGIGVVDDDSAKILQRMADQTEADTSTFPIVPGVFKLVDQSSTNQLLGTYYASLTDNENPSPVVTTPFVDFTGLGLLASVCLPVRPRDLGLQGVACLDISLTEIFADVLALNHGALRYAFITDYKGRAILHPLLPDALNYGQTVHLTIADLEADASVQGILTSMINGIAGNQSVTSTFVKARGNTTTDGVLTVEKKATYYWKLISMTSFSLCVVTPDDDREIDLVNDLHSQSFVYHQLNLVSDVTLCAASERLSTRSHSVVKLTDFAFKNRLTYLNLADSASRVRQYRLYMEDNSVYPSQLLKAITKKMVAVSESLEDVWTATSRYERYAVWRYYGDYFGSIRIYPGLTLPKAYDPTKRSWYVKAVSQPGKITLTTPYLDAFGAGIIATLAVPIYIGRLKGDHKSSDPILGVVGMDFKLSFIEFLIESQFEACKKQQNICFLVDTSGYIVYHANIEYETDQTKEFEGFHITDVEADIANYLIREDYLTKAPCIDFGSKRNLFTWRLDNPYGITKYNNTSNLPQFDLLPVDQTNVFIGIRKKTQQATTCVCPNRESDSYSPIDQCQDLVNKPCQCPCYLFADYDYCRNVFARNEERSSLSTCVPQPASIGFVKPFPNETLIVAALDDCVDNGCSDRTTADTCKGIVGCQWCPDGYCEERKTNCVDDTTAPSNTTEDDDDGPSGSQLPPHYIAVAVVCVIVVILVIVISVLAKKKKLRCKSQGRKPEPGRYEPDNNSSIYEPAPDARFSVMAKTQDAPFARPDVTENKYEQHTVGHVQLPPAYAVEESYMHPVQQDNPAFF